MADGQIDIKEDAAPTKELASQTHLHGGVTVHAEEICIVDAAGNLVSVVSNRLAVDNSGVVQPVNDNGGSLTVDALNLDIRDLVAATDHIDVGAWLGSAAPTVGQKAMASSLPVAIASDQSSLPVTKSVPTDLAPASPTAASVGVASAQVVAANASRKGLVLVNTSVNRISLGFGATAVLDNGVTLYPGGVFEMDERIFDLGAVNAIASAASSNLAIQEYS